MPTVKELEQALKKAFDNLTDEQLQAAGYKNRNEATLKFNKFKIEQNSRLGGFAISGLDEALADQIKTASSAFKFTRETTGFKGVGLRDRQAEKFCVAMGVTPAVKVDSSQRSKSAPLPASQQKLSPSNQAVSAPASPRGGSPTIPLHKDAASASSYGAINAGLSTHSLRSNFSASLGSFSSASSKVSSAGSTPSVFSSKVNRQDNSQSPFKFSENSSSVRVQPVAVGLNDKKLDYLASLKTEVNDAKWNDKGVSLLGSKVPTHIKEIRELIGNKTDQELRAQAGPLFQKVSQIIGKANATSPMFRDSKVQEFYTEQAAAIKEVQSPGAKSSLSPGRR